MATSPFDLSCWWDVKYKLMQAFHIGQICNIFESKIAINFLSISLNINIQSDVS